MKMVKRLQEVEMERDDLKAKLDEAEIFGAAARQAHAILSRGIKKALNLKNWPDFYKMYGNGLFATGVVRLLNETMDAKIKRIKSLEKKLRRQDD